MPTLMVVLLVPDVFSLLCGASPNVRFWAYFFEAMWGIGRLTFGLTMRYLGIRLGMAVALGYTAVFGTLIPPIFYGTLGQTLTSASGKFVLLGVLASVRGILVSGLAGMSKERELTSEQKQSAITEFRFGKGILIATFSGIMSSCFAFGLDAGTPMTDAAKTHLPARGASDVWSGLPVLITHPGYAPAALEQCDAALEQCDAALTEGDALVAQMGSVLITSRSVGRRSRSPPTSPAARACRLLSDRLSKTTGQIIGVDGGLSEAFLR